MSISAALEQLALALGNASAVPRGELVRALERAAERLRAPGADVEIPTDLVPQAEAARVVGVSRQAVNQWIRKGALRSYDLNESNGGRRGAMVSISEVAVQANRWRAEPLPASLRREVASFLVCLAATSAAPIADLLARAIDEPAGPVLADEGARVLREFLVTAMGATGRQEEFTGNGVQMLAQLGPAFAVDRDAPFGALADRLGLLIHSADGSAGFDAASGAVLGLLGCATVGARLEESSASCGGEIADAARDVWGEDWVRRLFDVAFHVGELVAAPLTRCTAALVYLGCNRFMRQAQGDGVSITYARSPGVILPQSYYGGPRLTALLHNRTDPREAWGFERGDPGVVGNLEAPAKSPFRIFNFAYGLFDDSIYGIRRYCFSTVTASRELRAFLDDLPRGQRSTYRDLAISTMAQTLQRPYVEMCTVEPPAQFDWWKDHIIRSSPRETIVGLRGEKARSIAHALVVPTSILPQVVEVGGEDDALRERLRLYVKNLDFALIEERYRDDIQRGAVRVIKNGSEELSADAARALAEAEVSAMLDPT